MLDEIKKALDSIRIALQEDGGDVEFVDYTEDKKVLVRLHGHCADCPFSQMTIKNGIEAYLKSKFDDNVVAVEAVK